MEWWGLGVVRVKGGGSHWESRGGGGLGGGGVQGVVGV